MVWIGSPANLGERTCTYTCGLIKQFMFRLLWFINVYRTLFKSVLPRSTKFSIFGDEGLLLMALFQNANCIFQVKPQVTD